LIAYNQAVRETNVTSQQALVSNDVIEKASAVSKERGLEIRKRSKNIKTTTSAGESKEIQKSEWTIKINSKFLLAIEDLYLR
jgi:hypothetical protein